MVNATPRPLYRRERDLRTLTTSLFTKATNVTTVDAVAVDTFATTLAVVTLVTKGPNVHQFLCPHVCTRSAVLCRRARSSGHNFASYSEGPRFDVGWHSAYPIEMAFMVVAGADVVMCMQ